MAFCNEANRDRRLQIEHRILINLLKLIDSGAADLVKVSKLTSA